MDRTLLDRAAPLFRIDLLIVDDDRPILRSIAGLFTSPVFRITTAESYEDAVAAIETHKTPWHGWILDIDLGDGHDGLEIMSAYPSYPLVTVLSGLQSMSLAAKAIDRGALHVFDKDPGQLDRLHDAVCAMCALGYVMDGKASQYLDTFRLLQGPPIKSVDQWARKACISTRQLQRICEMHETPGVRATITTYYGLYYLLSENADCPEPAFHRACLEDLISHRTG